MSRPPVFLAALALTGACTAGSPPAVLPTLAPRPSATPTPVAIPPAARAHTPFGAAAFVRFYFESLNQAFATGDAALIRTFSDRNCSTCENYATSLEQDGGHLVGDTFVRLEVAAPPLTAGGAIVEVFGRIASRDVVNREGELVKHLAAEGAFHFQVNVVPTASGWLVRGIRRATS